MLTYGSNGAVSVVNNHLNTGISPAQPWVQDVSWVNVAFGNDATGARNDPNRPFKTLNGAFGAAPAGSQDTIFILPTGNTGVVNSLCNADLTIDKPCQIQNECIGPNNAPGVLNQTITITNNTRGNVFFNNMTFFNNTKDAPCLIVQNAQDHAVWFRNCYFYRGTGTKRCIEITGAWPASGSVTHPVELLFERCDIVGKVYCAAGTAGAPFDKKGIVIFKDMFKSIPGATAFAYGTEVIIDSGYVTLEGTGSMPPITLNGGVLEINNSSPIPGLYTDNYWIKCAAVASKGLSFLIMRNTCNFSALRGPLDANLGKILIGANVVYGVFNSILPAALLEIDANAQEFVAYLLANSGQEFVNYNSCKVYGAGALLT